jgi:shikimate dehydrogenase/3-dehydroquinate dehydratase type I
VIVAVVARRTVDAARSALVALAEEPGLRPGDVMAEVRLDAMASPDPRLFENTPVPAMATCRRPRDGGGWRGADPERLALLRASATAGAAYVDVELEWAASLGRLPPPTKLVVSHHDFEASPADPRTVTRALLAAGADVAKLVVRVRNALDIMALSRAASEAPGRVVAFGLGPAGLPTRLLFDRFRSPWVYARYDGGSMNRPPDPALPVELPSFEDLTRLYRADPSLPAPEAVYAVLGDRAQESIGPRAINRVFRRRGTPAQFVPFPTHSIAGVREAWKLFGVRGVAVTTPYKEDALRLADDVHPRAHAVGAANTLVNEGGLWTAYNTDTDGVAEPVKAAFAAAGRRLDGAAALVVGVGGAGRAAAWTLRGLGLKTRFVARRPTAGGVPPLGAGVPVILASDVKSESADLVINATPAGSPRDPDGRAVDLRWLRPGGFVFETNYLPRETPLLREARARGVATIGGDAMYAAQAIAQLRLFRSDCDDADGELKEAVAWALEGR